MKVIFRSVLFVSLMTMGLVSCSDDDSDDVQPAATTVPVDDTSEEVENSDDAVVALPADVTAIAIGSPAHTILVQALTKADLVGALQAEGPFTVFAPTNDAFVALLATNDDWNSLDDIPADVLKAVLLDHVVAGSVTSSTLAGPYTTLGGSILTVEDLTAAGFTDGAIDLQAQNGYVHSINGVLLLAD